MFHLQWTGDGKTDRHSPLAVPPQIAYELGLLAQTHNPSYFGVKTSLVNRLRSCLRSEEMVETNPVGKCSPTLCRALGTTPETMKKTLKPKTKKQQPCVKLNAIGLTYTGPNYRK